MKLIVLVWMVLTAALIVALVKLGNPQWLGIWAGLSVLGGVLFLITFDPVKIK